MGIDRRFDCRLKGYWKKLKGILYNVIGIIILIFIIFVMYFKKFLCLYGEILLIWDDMVKNSVYGFCCGMFGFEKKCLRMIIVIM